MTLYFFPFVSILAVLRWYKLIYMFRQTLTSHLGMISGHFVQDDPLIILLLLPHMEVVSQTWRHWKISFHSLTDTGSGRNQSSNMKAPKQISSQINKTNSLNIIIHLNEYIRSHT